MAERVAALTPQQRALFLRSREKQRATDEDSVIPARTGPGPWPACADQAALWYFQQVDAEAVPYNIGNGQRLLGPLEPPLLERAYADLVRRQEMLRAFYPVVDGVPHVAIADDLGGSITWVDLRGEPAAERERLAQQAAARLINQPFDLEKGPIVRFVVIRLADDVHLMVPVMHHSITDAVSYNIFFRELIALYGGHLRGNPAPLPPITRHYIDYALWRNQWLASAAFQEQSAWWEQELKGAPTRIGLPGDYPRPKVFNDRGSRTFFKLSGDVTQRLRARNRLAGTTSLMTLLAGTFALFYRWADMRDMLIAVPASHREHREMAHVIGYFLNYVPFRGRITPGMSFEALLEATKTTVLGGLKHKRVPFSAMVEALKPERDPSAMPLAQLGFVYVSAAGLNTEAAKLHQEGAPEFRVEGYYADREISPMDLQFIFMEGADEVDCFIEYAADIYKRETMEQLAASFECLFDRLLAAPGRALELHPLGKNIPEALARARFDDSPAALHEPFFARAGTTPTTTAVTDGTQSFSYGELAQQVEATARALRALGVRGETPVGVCLKPGVTAVVVLLAVLRAGGTYLPLDMPPQRRRRVLDDCRPLLVIVDDDAVDADWREVALYRIGALAASRQNAAQPELPTRLDPDQTAAILHTSGSTGRPKGVMVTHRGLAHRLAWWAAQCPATPGEPFALTAGANVNEYLMEVFDALHQGGTLHVAAASVRAEPIKLAAYLEKHGMRRIQMVPSVLRLLVAEPGITTRLASLTHLVVHGESLPVDVAAAVRRKLPHCTLVNNYGLTEATGACAAEVTQTGELPGRVPVGFGLGGLDLYLMDGAGNPLPAGAVGELYLGGPALSRGYAGDAAGTAARFVPNPFGNGGRLFRTGDLARFDSERGLTILGRADRQLKIRGNRIEPGEIEAVLRAQGGVVDAAVLLVGDDLAAAVQTAGSLDRETLRQSMLGALPEAMIPTRFHFVEALPRTASGKTDLGALGAIVSRETTAVGHKYVGPTTVSERLLARIWRAVLHHPAPGIDDDFYELGGHSLRAAEVMARLNRETGRALPLTLLLQTRTIRGMARALDGFDEWQAACAGSAPALLGEAGAAKLFAFPPLLGFAMIYRPLAERLPGFAFMGFDFVDQPDPPAFYADQIENEQPEGPLRLLGYSAGGNLAFAVTQTLEARGRQVAALILVDSMARTETPEDATVLHRRKAAFLADLHGQVREDPVMRVYADTPYLLGLMEKTPGAFHAYHYRGCDTGTVSAPIYYVRGEAEPERTHAREAWASAATVRYHQGRGRHEAMFQGEALEHNAALLRDLLTPSRQHEALALDAGTA
nr:amino acid adenylation domain-containing protein [Acanthopleuribacter pedis]